MPQNLGLAQRKSTRFSIQLDIPNVHVRQRKASAILFVLPMGFFENRLPPIPMDQIITISMKIWRFGGYVRYVYSILRHQIKALRFPFRSMWAISTRITIPVEWPWLRGERSECHVPYVPRRVAVTNRDKKMFRWKACSGIYIMRVNHGKPVNEKAINLACDIDIEIYQEGFLKHNPLWGSRWWFCLIYHMISLRFTCSQLWSIDEHWWKQHVTQQYVDSY